MLIAVAGLAGLGVVFAATGWLYLVGPHAHLPGPRIGDALPLDELSRHSAVSLLLFVAIWGAAALLLGLLARLVDAERLSAALILALLVGLWCYLATAVSILVVRQISAEDAFQSAGTVRAVYVPAVLAGLAGAWFARPRPARPRAPLVLAALVAAAGLVGVLDAIFPEHATTLLAAIEPGARPLARSLAGPFGLALISVAPGLARRRKRAWQLAAVLLAGATVLHVMHSDYGAIPTALLLLALLSRRGDFDAPGDPEARPRVLVRGALLAATVYAYGFAALWANRLEADRPFGLRFAFGETTRALLALSLHGSPHLAGGFDRWFGPSVLVLGVVGAGWILHLWLAPWRYRHRQEAAVRDVARSLVQDRGVDSLAPFALRADKSYFFGDSDRAFLAYRVVASVAIVSGDPIGADEELPGLLDRFIEYARRRDWRIAVLGASDRFLPLYRARGLRALYHGDEAVVDVEQFSLDGRAIRKVRQSVHRLRKAGFAPLVLRPCEIDDQQRAELEQIARTWRGSEPQRGFVMEMDALFRLEDEDAVFVIGLGPDGHPRGFVHFAACHAARTLSLSSMPRLRDVPNGFNEWLVCSAIEWSREHGFDRVSLNFAPFAALLAPGAELSLFQRLQRRVLLSLKGHFQLDNLLHFNRKFFPSWQQRFVVYERRRDLPRVGIAALAAEAYLPFAKRGRA